MIAANLNEITAFWQIGNADGFVSILNVIFLNALSHKVIDFNVALAISVYKNIVGSWVRINRDCAFCVFISRAEIPVNVNCVGWT